MTDKVRRGVWLSGFLILVLIISLVGVVAYFIAWDQMNALLPAWANYCLISIGLLRPVSIIAVWFWSKSGVIAYVVLTFVAMLILVVNGLKFSLLGVGGAVLLAVLVWSKWQYMFWGLSLTPRHASDVLPSDRVSRPTAGGPET